MSIDIGDLLEFGSIDVYYLVWFANNSLYYLKDMTPSFDHIIWTKNQRSAFYFYTENEAAKHTHIISRNRTGVSFIIDELNILDEIVDFSV